MQACLNALQERLSADDTAGWGATATALAAISGKEDTREGIRAFFEKRPPVEGAMTRPVGPFAMAAGPPHQGKPLAELEAGPHMSCP
ncbi:MAG: hypothetical protein ABI433_00215 [Burkholderiaceae bacterium]